MIKSKKFLSKLLVLSFLLTSNSFALDVLIYNYNAAGDEATGLNQRQIAAGNNPTTINIGGGGLHYI
jgi:hypothetical protein